MGHTELVRVSTREGRVIQGGEHGTTSPSQDIMYSDMTFAKPSLLGSKRCLSEIGVVCEVI